MRIVGNSCDLDGLGQIFYISNHFTILSDVFAIVVESASFVSIVICLRTGYEGPRNYGESYSLWYNIARCRYLEYDD